MPDIIVSEFMDAAPLTDLSARFSVHRDDDLWMRPDDLATLIADASGLIVRNKTQVTDDLLVKAPKLKVVGRLGVGLDNIDMEACARRNVSVCPATGANADAVAEYVLTATLMLLRGAFLRSSDILSGSWPRAELNNGTEASGRTFGVIGFGNIGQLTARRAAAAGMHIMAFDPALADDDEAWRNAQRSSFEEVISNADVLSLHVPLSDATRHLVSVDVIARMRTGAVVINTARGGVVDEAALAAALHSGHLGGAALDVFEVEPPDATQIAAFAGLSNVILTPHVAGLSEQANIRVSQLTVDNVLRVLTSM